MNVGDIMKLLILIFATMLACDANTHECSEQERIDDYLERNPNLCCCRFGGEVLWCTDKPVNYQCLVGPGMGSCSDWY